MVITDATWRPYPPGGGREGAEEDQIELKPQRHEEEVGVTPNYWET